MSSNLRHWPPALLKIVAEATALPEVVVLDDPTPEALEACTMDKKLAVVAIVSAGPAARAAALKAGAIEAIDPDLPEVEARARIETAIARFRTRIAHEDERSEIDRQESLLRRDLLLAARLQKSWLPHELPKVEGYRFAAAYLPRDLVSGDAYDARLLDPTRVGFYTLDAMGHGIGSALLAVSLRAAFRPIDETGRVRAPHEVLSDLDTKLREADLADSPTAAFCYAVLDAPARRLAVSNAGHPLPVRLRKDGSFDHIGTTCLLLGVVAEDYVTVEVELAPGDRVFFHSDGAEPSYDKRFLDELGSRRDQTLEEQLCGALAAVLPVDGSGLREDDATVVALEVLGG
jgi:serine phosphatase RsbU (regulator of sigma subunit)